MGYWSLLFFISHIILNFVGPINSQPDLFGYVCGLNVTNAAMYEANRNNTHTTPMYEANKNTLLSSLSSNIGRYGFYNASVGQNSDRVNAIALCRGDVQLDICRTCVNDTAHKLPQVCGNYTEALGCYDNCLIRFSNNTIFHTVNTSPAVYGRSSNDVSNIVQFNQTLRTLLDSLRKQAASGDSLLKVATGTIPGPDFQTIYALSQCTPDLSEVQCNDCVTGAVGQLPLCCQGRLGGRILTPSCNFRFETTRFYDDIPTAPPSSPRPRPPPPGKDGSTTRTIFIILIPTTTSVIIVVFIFMFLRKKKQRKHKKPKQEFENNDEITSIDPLQHDFDTIRIATNNFSDNNKLGQGGFGAVYKGMLPNGKEIAVKRLSKNSGQGEQEFKNEVFLVVKLQHKNLVRLLGFCLERLLVYEFLPNASLDHFIFDPIKRAHLDWDMRYKIIGGVAKGLLYLHEDSQHRIIHRDLKASNILLDEEMNPKIADFGMARLFVLEETHEKTNRIVGTYGYMATEYAMHGQFSVKSDIFSFGVLVLEIVSGQKNNSFRVGENVKDLLSYAWKSWQNGTASNMIDPKMIARSGSEQDIMRCIHIGLLCVQENASNRPTIASVILMLNNISFALAIPSEPHFSYSIIAIVQCHCFEAIVQLQLSPFNQKVNMPFVQ